MGKGDRRTLRGKIYRGSYGKARLHDASPAVAGKAGVTRPTAARKAAPKKKA